MLNILKLTRNSDQELNSMLKVCKDRLKQLCDETEDDIIDGAIFQQMRDGGNLACAILYKRGKCLKKYIAHSAINKKEDIKYLSSISSEYSVALLQDELHYRTRILNKTCSLDSSVWDRRVDTESKIIEQLILDFKKMPKGKLILWTKMYPCPSCRSVIMDFKDEYPGVDITIVYSYKNSQNPCCTGGFIDYVKQA